MTMSHDHKETAYSFKHDTSNLQIFSILMFCISIVMVTLAITYVVFHGLRDDERVVKSVNHPELLQLREQEVRLLESMDALMHAVIQDYSR